TGTDHLVTTWLLSELHGAIAHEVPPSNPIPTNGGFFSVDPILQLTPGFIGASSLGTLNVVSYTPDHDDFMQIGQQLWALLIGCLGGVLASYVWRRRKQVQGAPLNLSKTDRVHG